MEISGAEMDLFPGMDFFSRMTGQPAAGQAATQDQLQQQDRFNAGMTGIGKMGALLLAAGQRLTPKERATIFAQMPQAMDGVQTDIYNAAQSRLMNMKNESTAAELARQKGLADRAKSDPSFAASLGLSPALVSAMSPADIAEVAKTRATQDPLDAQLKQAQIYHYLHPTAAAPTPQLVDLPGGGKGWATPGTSEVTPIGGAGKGGVDPENAKRNEGEGKALTYAQEAIAANLDLTRPNVSTALTSGKNRLLNKIPTSSGSWAGADYTAGERAGNSFIDSVMRPRSGAKIEPDELEREKQIFAPVPGDSADVLLKKAQLRAQHIQSLIAEANPADRPRLMKMFEDSQKEIVGAYQGGGSAPAASVGVRSITEIK